MKTALLIILSLGLMTSAVLAQKSFEVDFTENPEISDIKGNPINNKSIYFPLVKAPYVRHYMYRDNEVRWLNNEHLDFFINEFGKEKIKDTLFYHNIGPIHQRLYSKYLFELEEHILYNYFLGRDIVRFTYIPSFGHSVVIKMEKYADSTIMTLKKLDYQFNAKLIERAFDGDIEAISTCDNDAVWIINEQIKIDNNYFYKLQELIDNLNIKEEVPFYNIIGGLDGSDLIIEIHTESGYYYNKRWSPPENSSIYLISDYMMELSGLIINID